MSLNRFCFIVIATLFFLSATVGTTGSVPEYLTIREDVLKVRGDRNYPPFEYLNAHGEPEGFNIDIILAVAEIMGLSVSIELGPWSDVRNDLETGQIDILAGMYKTDERDKSVDFSTPHFITSYSVFVRKKNNEILSISDSRTAVILVQENDLAHDYVSREGLGQELITVNAPDKALKLLSDGIGDCAIVPRLIGLKLISELRLRNLKAVGPPVIQREYCLAVREGDISLMAKLNEGLSILKTTGRYDDIYNSWFGIVERQPSGLRGYIPYVIWGAAPLLLIALALVFRSRSLKHRLSSSEKLLSMALEASNAGIWQLNIKDGSFYADDRFISLLGYSREEFPRSLHRHFVHPDEWNEINERLAEYLRGKTDMLVTEHRIRARDGSWVWVHARASITKRNDRGKPVMITGTIHDITRRKTAEIDLIKFNESLESMVDERTGQLEKAQEEIIRKERLSVLGQLTATVSHELRNPLGVIRSSAFVLRRHLNTTDDKSEKHLTRIEQQVNICDEIVGDLLEYTRGKHLELNEGQLNSVILDTIEGTTVPHGINIQTDLNNELPRVLFDELKFRRVLINLFENAFHALSVEGNKADRSYRPTMTVTSAYQEPEVIISVSDNGTGMDQQTASRAFDPLFTTHARGTGLGLAIVRKIIHEHGGRVSISSLPGSGTTIIVSVPVQESVTG